MKEKNVIRMKNVENVRKIRLLLVKNGDFLSAYRLVMGAAEQLNLHVYLTVTAPEYVFPLLRADKADLAFGVFLTPEELKRYRMEGYTVTLPERHGKNQTLFFVMPRGSRLLWEILEKAMITSFVNGRTSFDLPADVEEKMEKDPGIKEKETGKMPGEDIRKNREEKENIPEKVNRKKSRREKLRVRILEQLQKMKKEK